MKLVTLTALITLSASTLFAHSSAESSLPANGAVLKEAPQELMLQLSDKVRMTRVEMTYHQGMMHEGGMMGQMHEGQMMMNLEVGDQTDFRSEFHIPMQMMGHGTYEVEWRGLGIDGHPVQGMFMFEVTE
ncbi:MAG: copper resistance CopC family protein [Thalassovita sp.]